MPKVQKRQFLFGLKGVALLIPALSGICFGQYKWEIKNPLPLENNFTSVAYVKDQFVAVGDAGAILTSTDGTSWTAKSSGTTNMLNAMTYGNNLYVAVGNSGTIVTSTDGATWTSKNSGTSSNLNSIVFGGNQFVAVGGQGMILTSSDGITWTEQNSGTFVNLRALTFGNNQFVVAGEWIQSATIGPSHSMILSSSDGIAWSTQYHASNTYVYEYFNSAAFKDGKFVIAGKHTSNNMCKGGCYAEAFVVTSTDGSTWTRAYSGPNNSNLASVIQGDSRFLAVGSKRVQNSQGYWDPEKALFLTSTDGAAWSEINPEAVGGFPARLTGAAYGNDEYLAIGQSKIEGDMYGALTPANRVVISRVSAGDACKATYLGNGTIEFEVKFAAPQQYVEVFVRQNGLQNVAQNIVNSVVNNGDGSFTYKFTRGGYAPGEFVEYRFYSYIQNGPRVFTPGPVENVWKNLVVNN